MYFDESDYQLTHALEVPELAPLPAIRSERAATVAKWFGIDELIAADQRVAPDAMGNERDHRAGRAMLRELLPRSGQITLLTAPSGAGKSSMLRTLRALHPRAVWIDLNAIEPPQRPLVDCFQDAPLDQTLALLSQVGLAEAWSYLRTPRELSEGQRWRLNLALGMHQGSGNAVASAADSCSLNPEPRTLNPATNPPKRTILLADEFAALLDRVTAAIVARCLRRVVSATARLCAIVATSHEDLTRALVPDTIVTCDFRFIEVRKRLRVSTKFQASNLRQIRNSKGAMTKTRRDSCFEI